MNAVAQYLINDYQMSKKAAAGAAAYDHLKLEMLKAFVYAAKTDLSLTEKQIGRLIEKFPHLPFISIDSLIEKFSKLTEIGLTTDEIVANPYLLGAPMQQVKFRKMIGGLVSKTTKSLMLLTHEKTAYARLSFLKEKKIRGVVNVGSIYCSEKKFEELYGIDTETLQKNYPLTKEGVMLVEEAYNDRYEAPLHLDTTEKKAVLKQSDAAAYRKTITQETYENE